MWRVAATLRTVGKGAPFLVEDSPDCYRDDRSIDLDNLLHTYDDRNSRSDLTHSALGVVFADCEEASAAGVVFLPFYNISRITTEDMQDLFVQTFGLRLDNHIAFNFTWIPFNLRGFRKAHLPLASAFQKKHGISLDAVLAVVAALCFRAFYSWIETSGLSITRYWQRSYEGPYTRDFVSNEIQSFVPAAANILQIQEPAIRNLDIAGGIRFWELDEANRTDVDLVYSGPHSIFLPFGGERVFIDFTWVLRRLHDLFINVRIPDQNFKGDALEHAIGKHTPVLSTKPLKSNDGQVKQIDYAASVNTCLVIVECKAVGRSIGFDRGNPEAIQYRMDNVVERALCQVDDKAKWLASHPLGTNYDITRYDCILPVAVSPFVEFIPTFDTRYWIADDIPRVLTPKELENLLANESLIASAHNKIGMDPTLVS